ncbi:hypothetical protein V8F20_002571 [Naviculisporaceae sp. PSN 640]
MLKAVRRSRSHRALLLDAVVSGSAGETKTQQGRGQQIEEPLQGGGQGGIENSRNNEGAPHGPTAPYNPHPNAVIPGGAIGGAASVSVPRTISPSLGELHQTAAATAAEPAIIHVPSKHGPGHVATAGHGHGTSATQNVDIPPIRFPDGRNPYLDRPLPLPPPIIKQSSSTTNLTNNTTPLAVVVAAAVPAPLKIARPIMPARPSTSSGSTTTTMMDSSSVGMGMVFGGLKSQSSFDRRISRDDMALELTTQMGMVRTSKGLQPYRIGIKGGALPTPEQSPNAMLSRSLTSSPMPGPRFVPERVMTPESLTSGEIQIGMALGSPSHATFIAGWEAQQEAQPQQMSPQQSQRRTPEPSPAAAPIQRQKTQKRRLFGLFGRKNVEAPPKAAAGVIEASNSSISLASNSSQTQTQAQSWQIKVEAPAPAPMRSNTVAGKRSTSKFRPLISRSGTENDMSRLQPQPPQVQFQAAPPQLSAGPGLLDIEIPDIRLERYSIMFSGVLGSGSNTHQPSSGQEGPGGASSLLARRQATLEKLKTINDRIQDEEDEKMRNNKQYRRATSPQPMNSPVFTLFPATTTQPRPSTLAPGQGVASRMRSNTSPALLPSPSKGSFDEANLLPVIKKDKEMKEKEKKTVTIISPRTMDERTRAAQVEKLREQQQQQRATTAAPPPQPQPTPVAMSAFRFGPEESALILDSPNSMTTSSDQDMDEVDEGEPFSPISDETFDREDSRFNFQPGTLPPFKPTLAEPQWEIISPPSTDTTTTTSLSESSKASGTSVITRKKRRPSISTKTDDLATEEADNDDDDDDLLKAAVEISIARQISISRQQRQMLLKPVQRSNTIASNNPHHGKRKPPPGVMVIDTTTGANGNGKKMITRSISSPNREIAASIAASRAAITDNGRVVETRLGVPRLVGVGGMDGNSPGSRRSERVVLEGV